MNGSISDRGRFNARHFGLGRVRRVHFVGIGGVGMGGIAEVLHTLGFEVSGSDCSAGAMVTRLRGLGIHIDIGHDRSHVVRAEAVVVSAAIAADNPEVVEARRRQLPVVPRAQMLAELMRFRHGIAVAGTHGKTTTTSLVASLLTQGRLDPTFVIGGRLISADANGRLGAGEYLVAEADESDGSFLLLQPVMAVVTNIDADHMSAWQDDFQRLRSAFLEFIHRLPFYGLAVLCTDDSNVREILPGIARPVSSYGIDDPGADFVADEIEADGSRTRFLLRRSVGAPLPLVLNLPGRHNVLNALAAIAVAQESGVGDEDIAAALRSFQGIGRRLQVIGTILVDGGEVTVIDDYAHHPREIEATVDAVRAGWPGRRLVVFFQPHRYTRTRDLFDDFAAVLSTLEMLIVLEVYAAGESAIHAADGRALCRAIRARGRVDPVFAPQVADACALAPDLVRPGDIVLTLGAGDISAAPLRIIKAIEILNPKPAPSPSTPRGSGP
ncbi:UDP-N-acetylmuramate--L-alanine ligase [Thioalkalivibrio sp. HK1]|uniref:UDP-N-acetylmuramate--L-alanine ligase n=1 Tax=Thioalkalivibrio sp. HK1 TaxID=1469245 RepID=UPI0004B2A515|nr:UDP-N-acetylmuramate--L-alanine ligase [Thioalkalivibrio sp. HK1]